ncbi:MAG: aminotransferase class V-fold PLP-dependent enzyme [Eubacteriales bacterium]|nr:aminotransferase class V-fold PLP-dependent enzyme [Eubacteriales bacterium]
MIYLDNSATTNPKPKIVISKANTAMIKNSFNSGRGGYKASIDTAGQIYNVREKAGKLLGFDANRICFTQNCTYALNMAIKGSIKSGDHVIISNLEHNAVARPIYKLALDKTIEYNTAKFSYDKDECVNNFKRLIRPETSLIVCMHASNVFGCLFPIKEIGQLAKDNDIRFIVDGAQTAGVLDIDRTRDNIDILCAPGHKGLYGPMGTGILAVGEDINLDTVVEGGTGSLSTQLSQPDFLPDRLESGTLNNSGIIALGAGIDFVQHYGTEKIYSHESALINYIHGELEKNSNVKLYTPKIKDYNCVPILSFNYGDYSSEKTASLLAQKGIAVRAGYHCAPLAHNAFSTSDRGTVRVSPSVFTTQRECEIFINYLKKL